MMTQTEGSRFAVDLGDVKLPPIVEKQVEAEIRTVVLRALAPIDSGGRSRWPDFDIAKFSDGISGMILNPEGSPRWDPYRSRQSEEVGDRLQESDVVRSTATKLQRFLRDLTEDESKILMNIIFEIVSRAQALEKAVGPIDAAGQPQTRSATFLMGIATGYLGEIAAKMAGGIAGHLAGGGSYDEIPWSDIASSSV